VAVGDPTERLPLPGALRMYAADEEWQETVDGLTGRAGVVILHAGAGDTALPAGESERARALRRLAREFKIASAPRWVRVPLYVVVSLAVLWLLERIMSSVI
jgi:hypothetical protein